MVATFTETPLVDVVAGDRVWSFEDDCAYTVDAAIHVPAGRPTEVTLIYAGGIAVRFDLDQVRYVSVATEQGRAA